MKDKTKNIIRETLEWTASIALFGTFGIVVKGMSSWGKDYVETDLAKTKLMVELNELCYESSELGREIQELSNDVKRKLNVTIN